jgi:hypothetical protein
MNFRVAMLAMFAALICGAGSLPEVAHAGSYPVGACAGTPGNVNHSWTALNTNPSYLETSSNCGAQDVTGGGARSGATSGLAADDILELSTNVPSGATAGWTFQAPDGTTITAATWDRDLFEQSDGWTPEVLDGSGNVLPGETCQFVAEDGGCEVAGTATHTGLDTDALTIEVVCTPEVDDSQTCGNGFSEHEARVELDSASITLTDETPPSVSATGGTLFASGYQHGILSATVSGSDPIGVQYTRVYIDGQQVAQQSFACDFTYTVPCASRATAEFEVDTSKLTDGPHKVQVSLVDAAGNETMSSPQTLMVWNKPLPVPIAGQVQEHPNGWTSQPTTLTWTNPSVGQGPSDTSSGGSNPQLRITGIAEEGRRVLIHGTVARKLHGHVVVVETYIDHGRKQTVHRTAKISAGRWTIVLMLPTGAQPQSTTVVVHSVRGRWRHQFVTRHAPSRAGPEGRAATVRHRAR